jgi:hypothetical protein
MYHVDPFFHTVGLFTTELSQAFAAPGIKIGLSPLFVHVSPSVLVARPILLFPVD